MSTQIALELNDAGESIRQTVTEDTQGRASTGVPPTVSISAFEKLYHRSPDDGERLRLVNIQQAIGLEHTSEWWVFFLTLESSAARLSATLDHHLKGVEAALSSIDTTPAQSASKQLLDAMATHRTEIEELAANVRRDLIQSTQDAATAGARDRLDRTEAKMIKAVADSVTDLFEAMLIENHQRLTAATAQLDAAKITAIDIKKTADLLLQAQAQSLESVCKSVGDRVLNLVRSAQDISIGQTLRSFSIFGGIGCALGVLIAFSAITMLSEAPKPDTDALELFRWASSADGLAARQLDVNNAGSGGISALARCVLPARVRKDGAICTASFLPVK